MKKYVFILLTVLWSQSNLDRLRLRFRVPALAPDNNIFVTQILVKSAVLKTKVNNFFFFLL